MRKIVYALACIGGIVLHACQSYEDRRIKESKQEVRKVELETSDTASTDSVK